MLCEYNSLVAKEIKHLGAELTVGRVYGGSAPNAIAETATLEGTLRARSKESIDEANRRFEHTTSALALCHGVEAEIDYGGYAPPLINDGRVCGVIYTALSHSQGLNRVIKATEIPQSTASTLGGSEDFAHFSERIPSCLLGIAAGEGKCGYIYPLHHPMVDFDEGALYTGATALHSAARALLSTEL